MKFMLFVRLHVKTHSKGKVNIFWPVKIITKFKMFRVQSSMMIFTFKTEK